MLISILGNLIDTTKIYQITPIKGNCCWGDRPTTDRFITHSAYYFEIMFLNKKSLKVSLNCNDVVKIKYWYDTQEEYKDALLKTNFTIEELRNSIIKYWNKNKSEIPFLEFKID